MDNEVVQEIDVPGVKDYPNLKAVIVKTPDGGFLFEYLGFEVNEGYIDNDGVAFETQEAAVETALNVEMMFYQEG